MSIENTLERIAKALEAIAVNTAPVNTTSVAPVAPTPVIEPVTDCVEQDAPAPTAPTAPTAPAAPAPAAPAPVAAMTAQQLNEELVKEYNRLGDRSGIDKSMQQLGVTSVNALDPNQYQELLDLVRAL